MRKLLISLLTLLILVILVSSCKRKPVPVAKNHDDILCIFVNGLGNGQLQDVEDHFLTLPNVSIVTFSDHDDWKNDVSDYISHSSYNKLVLIGHSWGCARIVEDCAKADLVIMYDPVAFNQGRLILRDYKSTIVFARDGGGLPAKADIAPTNTSYSIRRYTIVGGHNDIPHNKSTFPIIDSAMGAL